MTYPDNIIAAFREVALGLMDWQDPPLMSWREYRRREAITGDGIYRPYDPQGNVEPYDVNADWNERS